MASTLFYCLILMTGIVTNVMSATFPLKDCIKDDGDLLSLLDYDIDQIWVWQNNLIRGFSWDMSRIHSGGSRSQWRIATVVDKFSALGDIINVSDWSFNDHNDFKEPYMMRDTNTVEVPIRDIRTRLELKIQAVERLFDEMSGVRKHAIQVGVVFLDGRNLTQEEIRSVPSIVQQQLSAGVKIFTVIFGSKLVEEIVHLTDALVLPAMKLDNNRKHLLMALCKQCGRYWVLFEHKTGLSMLSCFSMYNSRKMTSWTSEMSSCKRYFNGYLAVIETVEEMLFLKERLYTLMKENGRSNTQYHIGLRRDLGNYAKRFQWVTDPGSYRPMLIQNWLPRNMFREYSNTDCVVWQFASPSSHDNNSSNVFLNSTSDNDIPNEGWTNVNCHSEISSSSVCEVVLPQRINYDDFIFRIQVPPKSVNFLITNEHFLTYGKNIVSVSANVPNPNFVQFLKTLSIDFPIFDCGEDAGDRRYISYNMVCDFVDHCSNKRDELLCLNPRELFGDGIYCTSGQMLYNKENKCDNVKDCRDGSDEENCLDKDCASVRCQDGSCLPLQWVDDGEFDCFVYMTSSTEYIVSDESSKANLHLQNNTKSALVCTRDICTDESQLNDSIIDCRDPDIKLFKATGKLKPANTCKKCFGHFIWAPNCHYIKDRYGGIVGCRDMSHLRDCENFQCGPGYVKCYNSYCIPDHYLRDGKADCPTGEDEQLFYTGPCTGHFACWDSNICLHPDLVCDGHSHCPYDDDELDCPGFCPPGFRCIAGTVSLSDYNRSVSLDMQIVSDIDPRTRYLDLSGVEVYGFDSYLQKTAELFHNLKVLILSKCKINELPMHHILFSVVKDPPFMIQKLDISHNSFEIFSKYNYNYHYQHLNFLNLSYNRQLTLVTNLRFSFLEILDLSYTSLSYLDKAVFANLPKLKHLNLSHTLISDFTRQYFSTKLTLQSLDLRGMRTEDLDDYLFHGLTISQALYTDHFQICCPQIQGLVISPRACIAPVDVDVISSCLNLLGLDIQRFLLWIVAILAVLGNVTVIVYRIIWDRSVLQTGYGLFVTNLGISDFIMGVYLFIIAGADYFYRDNYVLYDKSWRNSVVCKIAGFMACLSCEASTFFVFLITLDRFLVMKFPFGQIKCTGSLKIIAVVMSWVASFLLALVPIVFSFDIYSSNAMCLGLPLTNTQAKGWEYSVGVFIIYNLIMFFFIACGQYAIFRAMSENRISNTATSMSSSRRAKEITVAKQLSLVVVSNFLFWVPVGIMGLMSLGGHEVSSEVYAWTTVLLLPINSAANPVLYTIPALMERWDKFKHGNQRTLSASV